jgi:hypothetical protein
MSRKVYNSITATILSLMGLALLIVNARRSYVRLNYNPAFLPWEIFQVCLFWGLMLYFLWSYTLRKK